MTFNEKYAEMPAQLARPRACIHVQPERSVYGHLRAAQRQTLQSLLQRAKRARGALAGLWALQGPSDVQVRTRSAVATNRLLCVREKKIQPRAHALFD